MHNPTNPTLEEVVAEIEENNQKIFNDPFDEIYLTMREVYKKYLSDDTLCKKPYIYKEFMNHVEITLEDLDDTSSLYTEASEECRTTSQTSILRIITTSISPSIRSKILMK